MDKHNKERQYGLYYGDRALMAGIRFGVDKFCKRFDVDEKYKKRIEEIKKEIRGSLCFLKTKTKIIKWWRRI